MANREITETSGDSETLTLRKKPNIVSRIPPNTDRRTSRITYWFIVCALPEYHCRILEGVFDLDTLRVHDEILLNIPGVHLVLRVP